MIAAASVPQPAQPRDNGVTVPAPATFPPTRDDVFGALKFRHDVERSMTQRPPDIACTQDDRISAIEYEHAILTQAAVPRVELQEALQAALQEVLPPILQQSQAALQEMLPAIIQQSIRSEVVSDFRKLLNRGRGDGTLIPFSVVPFVNGQLPTQDPHNLPVLDTVNAVENLQDQDLISYLTGYGIQPLPDVPGDPNATNRARRNYLRYAIGAVDM